MEVDAQAERAIFLLNEENRCAMSRLGRMNETDAEILIKELIKRLNLGLE